ncbi:3400_t:CDS:2, partial [Racocetra persica]
MCLTTTDPSQDNTTTTDPTFNQDNTTTTDPTFSQDNTALVKKMPKKRKSAFMQAHSTNIKVIDHHHQAINLDNDKQSAVVPKDNVSSLLKNCFYFSVRKSNNIENISEHSAQDSGGKRKREHGVKKPHIKQELVKSQKTKIWYDQK